MNKFKKIIELLLELNLCKSLYINYLKLPFRQAIYLPIFINHHTNISSLKGKIIIQGPIKPGLIRFNNHSKDFLGLHHWRKIHIDGIVIFNGEINIGVGATLFVRENGVVIFGNNIHIGGCSKILCDESILIKNNVRIAHESQLMDSNFHYIRNIEDGSVEKCTAPIIIGNNNWIGNRTTVMKGTITQDFTIVGSNSILNKDYTKTIEPYSIIGGAPAKFLKKGFERIFDYNEEETLDIKFGRKNNDAI